MFSRDDRIIENNQYYLNRLIPFIYKYLISFDIIKCLRLFPFNIFIIQFDVFTNAFVGLPFPVNVLTIPFSGFTIKSMIMLLLFV